ncbi:immunoglobulin-like domain-containing protein, partial [Oleiphilus sp. HI0080]|uniref:immunoglobulin-like domain-containing protein n=1 Tax=Oleiphilus sp. HI0080 TaxID=1822255 RepID=UPI003516BDD5
MNPVNVNVAGSYSVTYDVSDAANNAASQVTRTVIVADTTPPVITLVGAPTVNIEQGDTYNDAGATASDSVDGPLTGSISTNNPVNTNIPGTYTVTYNVSDVAGNFAAQVTRTVIVADTTPPAISLIGSSTVNVEQGTSYSDAGATASDSVDGVITANITVSGDTVDPATAGSYVIRYDVTDAAGNAAPQVTRTIIVADTTPPLITLAGSALVNHEQGTAYSDSGATANDTVDGSVSITVGGDTVNSAVAGTYTITFDAVDAAGNNATQVTRTVIVADTMAPLISLTGLANIDLERGD